MINAQIWGGCGSIRIVDMTNANKRGKTCDVISIDGGDSWSYERANDKWQAYRQLVGLLTEMHGSDFESRGGVNLDVEFETILKTARELGCNVIERDAIRGIDAPKPVLTAGVDGAWSASAGSDGVSLADHTDRFNEPREITSGQTANAAYKLAAKVWGKLANCTTMHEASRILSEAGCRLHYYCAMD
jgi:hypothetical protein